MVCDKSLESQIPEHLRHLLRYESSPLLGHEREALSSEELIEEKNRFLKDIEPHLEEIEIWLVGLFRYPDLKARYQGFFKTLIVRF